MGVLDDYAYQKKATKAVVSKDPVSAREAGIAAAEARAANAARSSAAESSRLEAQAKAYANQQAKIKSDAAAKAKADALAKARLDAAKKAPILTNPELAARAPGNVTSDKVNPEPEASNTGISAGDSSGNGNSGSGSSGVSPVKTATPDIITIDQETLPADLMTSLIFENIGGQELISVSRHDLISGSNMDFQSIKNLNEIYLNHNSLNIIPMPDSAMIYEKNFPISWASHIVEEFSSADSTHILIDPVAKELQILVANMKPGEQIEVEVLSSISEYNNTYGSYPESF
jgi:hypothetical protein